MSGSLAASSPALGLRPLLARIWRRRLLFLAVFLATLLLAALALLAVRPVYVASASVIVGEVESGASRVPDAWVQKIGDPADLQSQAALIRSPRLVRAALARNGAMDGVRRECERAEGGQWYTRLLGGGAEMPCTALTPGSDASVSWAMRRFTVAKVEESRVISVSYRSELPDTARDMANTLVQSYLDDPRAIPAPERDQAIAKRRQDLLLMETGLRDDEARLTAMRRTGAARTQLLSTNGERLTAIATRLAAAQLAMAEAAVRMQRFQRGLGGPPDIRAALDARPVVDVKQQFDTLTAQLAAEAAGSAQGPALRAQRDALKLRLDRDGIPAYRASNRAYLGAAAQAATLQRQLETTRQEVADTPNPEGEIAALERSIDLRRQLYVDAARRASERDAELPVSISNSRLVNLAERPFTPVSPRTGPFYAGGLLLALLAGTLAARIRDTTDHTVRAANEVESLSVPVLAQIPRVAATGAGLMDRLPGRQGGMSLGDTLTAAQRSPVVQDALRGLHARLVLAGRGGERRRTLLVTSFAPREGKTFTTLALAQLIAASGRRVLVIECDLRCPTFAAALNLSSGPGLGDVLRGFVAPKEAITRTSILTLDAIPAGPPCADSTELLLGGRMTELLAWADDYDYVLLDTPPTDALMDARVLSKTVDGVLVCTRWGGSKLNDLSATLDGVRMSGGYVYGVAVTMVETRQHALFDPRPVRSRAYMVEQ